ncbi:hypothetical protein ACRRTK_013963 [Alexandromys fortis]
MGGPNLFQPFQVLAQLVVQAVGQNLAVLPVLHILLSVQEPVWDLVRPGILHDRDHTLHLVLGELSSPLGEFKVCFPQHHMRVSPPHTLNGSDGKSCFLPLIHLEKSSAEMEEFVLTKQQLQEKEELISTLRTQLRQTLAEQAAQGDVVMHVSVRRTVAYADVSGVAIGP